MNVRHRYAMWIALFAIALIAGALLVGLLNERQVDEKIREEEKQNANTVRNTSTRR